MKRVFGKKKPEAPPVNVSDVGGKIDARVTDLDMKVSYYQWLQLLER